MDRLGLTLAGNPASLSSMPQQHQAVIVADEKGHVGIDNLNHLLAQGWTPVDSCPMSSSTGTGSINPTCLVILKAPASYEPGDENEPTPAQQAEIDAKEKAAADKAKGGKATKPKAK